MNFINVIFEPAILIIIFAFIGFLALLISNYMNVYNNLTLISNYLHGLTKKELSYKFNQLDEFMRSNSYISNVWEDFRKAIIFPDKMYIASHNTGKTNDYKSDIYLTIDASYFFNDESLIISKINHRFIQIMPTILTGFGPFFTFLKMAIAFAAVNFSADVNVSESLSALMINIRLAALCSVFAVGFSLCFMIIDKLLYARLCKVHSQDIQNEFTRLFDIVTSEKFLIDLLRESKMQVLANEKLIKFLPESLSKAISVSMAETTIPYLENIIYSLNKLNESLNKGNNGDVVDKLF